MDKRISIFNILRSEGKLQKIWVYPAQMVENDPREHTRTPNFQQGIPLEVFVRDVSVEAIAFKYFGTIPSGSKQLFLEKKYLNTIKSSYRIKIDDEYFSVYRDGSKDFSIIIRSDYIIAIVVLSPINY